MSTMSTEKRVNSFRAKMAHEIGVLTARREFAVSAFRQAAEELKTVNEGLAEQRSLLNGFADDLLTQVANLNTQIDDNDRVRAKILDIIGE